MEIRVQIVPADLWAVTRYVNLRMPRRAVFLYACLLVILWSVFTGATSGLAHRPLSYRLTIGVLTTAMVVGPICLLMYLFWRWSTLRRATRTPGMVGEHRYIVNPYGMKEQTPVSEMLTAWKGATRLVSGRDHVYVFAGPCVAHVIPRRAFAGQTEVDAFIELATSYLEAARS